MRMQDCASKSHLPSPLYATIVDRFILSSFFRESRALIENTTELIPHSPLESRVEALFGTRAPTFTVWLKRLTCCRIELQLLLDRVLSQKLKQEQFERFDPDPACMPQNSNLLTR